MGVGREGERERERERFSSHPKILSECHYLSKEFVI
jgi:hypothetical protein